MCVNPARRPIAAFRLTEAHVAGIACLLHAHVIHHEEVDLQISCACSPDGHFWRVYLADNLHAASVTVSRGDIRQNGRRHVEGVIAGGVIPRVAIVTLYVRFLTLILTVNGGTQTTKYYKEKHSCTGRG